LQDVVVDLRIILKLSERKKLKNTDLIHLYQNNEKRVISPCELTTVITFKVL
jgi:hypothetical protein